MRDPRREAAAHWMLAAAAAAFALARAPATVAAPIHPGFSEQVVGDTLDSPVSMAFAPDGRLFVCEQGGRLRVIREGRQVARPFATLPTYAQGEQGLLGVAFDREFATNHFVFVIYTCTWPVRHQRLARLTASGDTALAGSERVLLELDRNHASTHVGGSIRVAPDGTLFLGVGDNDDGSHAQSLLSSFGKLLRVRTDGTPPADNPFFTVAPDRYRSIWARGFRNPFSFDFDPKSGRLFVNDIGGSRFEEIDEGVAGGNYGWPIFEGPSDDAHFRGPIAKYDHAHGCAITGGCFYDPVRPSFAPEWLGSYFFAEYCRSEIRWLDPRSPGTIHRFGATRVPGPVDLRVGPDGDLYYLARGNTALTGGDHSSMGFVIRISPTGGAGAGARTN